MYESLLDDPSKFPPKRQFLKLISYYINEISTSKETRNIFFFLLLNLSFCVVEFLYGYWNNSLGLLSDAIHMLFDSTAIICSLVASVITKWPKTRQYTYGYGRVETITGFINALLLIFTSLDIMIEALERFFVTEVVKEDGLLTVSVLGLIVNILGIFAFDHGGAVGRKNHDCGHDHSNHDHSHHDHAHHDHGHGHDHGHSHAHHDHGHSHGSGHNPLMHGMLLHIIADALGSIGVIISSLLIQYYGWYWSDPVCSLFIGILTVYGSWPLLVKSTETLLQKTSPDVQEQVQLTSSKLMSTRGIIDVKKLHCWELYQGYHICTIVIVVEKGVDGRLMVEQVKEMFNFCREVVVQVENDVVYRY